MIDFLIGLILVGCGYTFRWSMDRAEQRARFERSITRFNSLTNLTRSDVIDLRDRKGGSDA